MHDLTKRDSPRWAGQRDPAASALRAMHGQNVSPTEVPSAQRIWIIARMSCWHMMQGATPQTEGKRLSLNGPRVAMALPADTTAETLRGTAAEIHRDVVDDVIQVDDPTPAPTGQTASVLRVPSIRRSSNQRYRATAKTCYRPAIQWGPHIPVAPLQTHSTHRSWCRR